MRPRCGLRPAVAGLLLALVGFTSGAALGAQALPQTGAERSGWARPTSHAELLEFLRELDERSPHTTVEVLGTTVEGRTIPVVFVGSPTPTGPGRTFASDRPTVLVLGSIHGDEPAGREGALQLLREVALGDDADLLDRLNLIVVPSVNPDGGEARRRENALGSDLNRDWIVAESPEVRAVLEGLVTRYWPEVWVDVHNGGSWPYHLTFQATLEPSADPELVAFARGPLHDAVQDHLAGMGMEMFWYSGPAFDRETGRWSWRTTEPLPRKQHSYGGLQDMIALLYEIPGRHGPEAGATAAREGLRALLHFTAERSDEVRATVEAARSRTRNGDFGAISLEIAPVPHPEPETFWVLPALAGRAGSAPERVTGEVRTLHRPTRARELPWGYALGPELGAVVELLALHGIEARETAVPLVGSGEVYRVEDVFRARERYQGHYLMDVGVALEIAEVRLPAGSFLVPVGQPGGRLLPQLLEPDAVDSVVRWNFLDAILDREGVGAELPIVRLERAPGSGVS